MPEILSNEQPHCTWQRSSSTLPDQARSTGLPFPGLSMSRSNRALTVRVGPHRWRALAQHAGNRLQQFVVGSEPVEGDALQLDEKSRQAAP